MSRQVSRAAALLVAVLLPLAVAPVASAETWTDGDGRRDVAEVQYSIPLDGAIIRPAREIRHADVTRVTIEHTTEKLRVRLDLRDVTRVRRLYRQVRARVVTPDETFVVDTGRRPGPGKPRIFDAELHEVSCDGVAFSVRPASDAVALSLPTSCLGSPETVRVGVVFTTTYGTVAYQDDPRTGRITKLRDGRLSPPIAVG